MYRHLMSTRAGRGRWLRGALAPPLALCLLLPVGAAAQAPEDPAITPAEASTQLEEAATALSEPADLDPTAELRDLVAALPYLEGPERRRAKTILARPPNGEANASDDPAARWSNAATISRDYYDSPGGQFRVHYVTLPSSAHQPEMTDTGGAVGVPDYVEQVAAYADLSFATQNADLGWPPPKDDGSKGDAEVGTPASGRTDIYLSNLGCSGGCLYGYAAVDDSSENCNTPPFRCFAYLVLDNDYAETGYGYGGVPDVPLQVTTAHEYNHILQFRLDTLQDLWMFESTAVWAEEKTFPNADDWIRTFMGRWVRQPHVPLAKAVRGRIYGSAVWNHWLELGARYGADVILDSWERSRKSRPKDYGVGAFSLGIRANGGRDFSHEFARFAAATAEWRVLDGNFPGSDANGADEAQLRDVRRQGRLRRGGSAQRFVLDHTAYRLLRVRPRGRNVVRLRVRAPRGVRSGIALVARDGSPRRGRVRIKRNYRRRGGRLRVRLQNARDYERITAVVVNADGRVSGFGGFDWIYAHNNERYRARLR